MRRRCRDGEEGREECSGGDKDWTFWRHIYALREQASQTNGCLSWTSIMGFELKTTICTWCPSAYILKSNQQHSSTFLLLCQKLRFGGFITMFSERHCI